MNFDRFYESLQRQEAHAKGRTFENGFRKTMKDYFRQNKTEALHFSDVWLWNEWPLGDTRDLGIDLVAKERESGKLWAIQCKAHSKEAFLSKQDIDSFLALSSKRFGENGSASFSERLIVTTAKGLGPNASEATRNQRPPCRAWCYADLAEMELDWDPEDNLVSAKTKPKVLFGYQEEAIKKVVEGFASNDKGKLIMACGTGKSIVSLRLLERTQAKRVLYLAPSLALMNQIVRMYAEDRLLPQRQRIVCGDATIKSKAEEENEDLRSDGLGLPATNEPKEVVRFLSKDDSTAAKILFCTYQSLDKVEQAFEAAANNGSSLEPFDLVLCDEAHRTTGKRNDFFTKINQDKIPRIKTLYMTATPRIYNEKLKDKYQVDSMDDERIYGREFYRYSFRKAINEENLSDYRVAILMVQSAKLSEEELKSYQEQYNLNNKDIEALADEFDFLMYLEKKKEVRKAMRRFLEGKRRIIDQLPSPADDAASVKKIELREETDSKPIMRLLNFTSLIAESKRFRKSFYGNDQHGEFALMKDVEVRHVDGSMSSSAKAMHLRWLREEERERTFKILSNARCLTEGVDVPAIDGLIFSRPKRSHIDVVQAIGRAIRKSPNKTFGYIIVPVILPPEEDPNDILNAGPFERVWQILKALRSHDDAADAEIDNIRFGEVPNKISLYVDGGDSDPDALKVEEQNDLLDRLGHLKLYATLLAKVGDKHYMDKWNDDVARLSKQFLSRINEHMQTNVAFQKEFAGFKEELETTINPTITNDEIKVMLAQHLMTEPIFNMLFSDPKILKQNALYTSLMRVLETIKELRKERDSMDDFYDMVRTKTQDLNNYEGRREFLTTLYEKFFQSFARAEAKEKGIVYTPQKIVQFMIRFSDWVLQRHVGCALEGSDDQAVHIIDPFTGTGNYIVNTMQYLASAKKVGAAALQRKFRKELHANEISLLAYYIASINIEAAYGKFAGASAVFENICLVDTFITMEATDKDIVAYYTKENAERIERQKKLPLKVIITNPPYYSAKKDANQGIARTPHAQLDQRIKETYIKESKSKGLKNSLYDYYIKAFRWGTDRLEQSQEGVLCFITNNGFLNGNSFDGFRKCLLEDFDVVYHIDLKGNLRVAKEERDKQGGNVFNIMTGVGITVCVRNKAAQQKKQGEQGKLYLYRIDDFMKGREKLNKLADFKAMEDIPFKTVVPQGTNWINTEDPSYEDCIPLGSKENKASKTEPTGSLFWKYSMGITTNRDNWAIDSSRTQLEAKMQSFLKTYNEELEKIISIPKDKRLDFFEKEVTKDPNKIKWVADIEESILKGERIVYQDERIESILYRPFYKAWVYKDKKLNWSHYQMPSIYPTVESRNTGIMCTGPGAGDFSALSTNCLVDFSLLSRAQYFPFWYWHSERLMGAATAERRENVTAWGLRLFQRAYSDAAITKADIMHYVYGVLHLPDYRRRYKNNLFRHLPRVPLMRAAADFVRLRDLGRALFDLHLRYDEAARSDTPTSDLEGKLIYDYGVQFVRDPGFDSASEAERYRINKGMRLVQAEKDSTAPLALEFNSLLRVEEIPASALHYKISGYSPIEHVLRSYRTKDLKNGYHQNPNNVDGGGHYIYRLVLGVLRLSLSTVEHVGEVEKEFASLNEKMRSYREVDAGHSS